MLSRHARCVLSRLRCNGHSLLLSSYLFKIGRIKNPSCSACGHLSCHSALSSYGLFAPLTLWRLSVSLQPLGSFPASGAPWSSAMPPSLERGRVTTTTSIIMQKWVSKVLDRTLSILFALITKLSSLQNIDIKYRYGVMSMYFIHAIQH